MSAGESNESLFARFRSDGDPDAFRQIFERTARIMARGAHRMGIDSADVEDVVQETYLGALLAAGRFDPSRDLVDWLWGIMCKKAVDVQRRRSRRELKPERMAPRDVEEPIRAAESGEISGILDASLSRLSDPYREVLRLRYERQWSAENIARELGRSPSTVRTQISRGVAQLRDALPAGLTPALLGVLALPALLRGMGPGTAPAVPGPGSDAAPPASAAAPAARRPWLAAAAALLLGLPLVLMAMRSGADAGAAALHRSGGAAPRAGLSASSADPVPAEEPAVASAAPGDAPRGAGSDRAPPRRARVRVQLVTRLGGEPVPEVTIGVQAYPGPYAGTVREPWDLAAVATTDAQGIAEFAAAPIGRVRLRLSNGQAAGVHEIVGDQTLVVAVDRVAIVEGVVRDQGGEVVAGAGIWTLEPATSAAGDFYPGVEVTRTARDGTFRVVLVDLLETKMWATSPTGRSRVVELALEQPLIDGLALELLPARGALRGTVADRHGRPAKDILVMVYPAGDQRLANVAARPDPNGAFELRGLVPGSYSVVATAPKGAFASQRVEVAAGAPAAVSLVLSPGGQISGRVTSERGDPLANVCVIAVPEPEIYRLGKLLARMTWTGGDGRFDLARVPPGRPTLGVVDPATGRAVAVEQRGLVEGQTFPWSPVVRPGAAADVELARYVEAVYHAVQPVPSGAVVLDSRTAGAK